MRMDPSIDSCAVSYPEQHQAVHVASIPGRDEMRHLLDLHAPGCPILGFVGNSCCSDFLLEKHLRGSLLHGAQQDIVCWDPRRHRLIALCATDANAHGRPAGPDICMWLLASSSKENSVLVFCCMQRKQALNPAARACAAVI